MFPCHFLNRLTVGTAGKYLPPPTGSSLWRGPAVSVLAVGVKNKFVQSKDTTESESDVEEEDDVSENDLEILVEQSDTTECFIRRDRSSGQKDQDHADRT